MTEDEMENSIYCKQQQQLAQISRETAEPHRFARASARSSRSGFSGAQTLDEVTSTLVKQQKAAQLAQNSVNNTGPATPVRQQANPQEKKDQIEAERVRHINEDINKQFWTSLDLSGQGLMTTSPRLFAYTFLQRLYLGHNNLASIPVALTRMPQLRVLDLSSNNIHQIIPEVGLMVSLRHLFLFDNQITTLPSELGSLFQLEVLGLEGNPLEPKFKKIMANEGTRGLITELRDHAPVGDPPQPRKWIELETEYKDNPGFTVLSYNTLCEKYASPQLYGYTPSWALDWSYRQKLLLEEVHAHESDVICLQEVNTVACDEVWYPYFDKKGFKSLFYPKTRARTMASAAESRNVDGCVIFYRESTLKLISHTHVEYNTKALLRDDLKKSVDTFNRVMTKDNVALVAIFEHIKSGNQFMLANTHLHWDPAFSDVKLVQSAILLEEMEKYSEKHSKGKYLPMVVCGDFNSDSHSGVYQLFSQSKVEAGHPDMLGYSYGEFTEKGIQSKLNFNSAYMDGLELPFTNYTPNFVESIDYIWYSSQQLAVTALLGPVDQEYAKHYVGFPNPHHPSDHIPIRTNVVFTRK